MMREGQIVSANPAAEKILGLSLDQLQRRMSLVPRWKAIHEDGADFPGEAHPAMVALRTGKPVKNVVMGVFNPLRNDTVWLKIDATPQFRPGEEKPYQVYAIFDDITERKRAEEEERRSRELAEQLAGELTVIAEIGRLIGSTLNIEEVYERFAAEARKLIPFDRIVVNLNRTQDKVRGTSPMSPGRMSPIGTAARCSRYPKRFHPPSGEPGRSPSSIRRSPTFEAGLRSMMSVPLFSHDEVIGGLHFRAEAERLYRMGSSHGGTDRRADRRGDRQRGALREPPGTEKLRSIRSAQPTKFTFLTRRPSGRSSTKATLQNLGFAEASAETPLDIQPELTSDSFEH